MINPSICVALHSFTKSRPAPTRRKPPDNAPVPHHHGPCRCAGGVPAQPGAEAEKCPRRAFAGIRARGGLLQTKMVHCSAPLRHAAADCGCTGASDTLPPRAGTGPAMVEEAAVSLAIFDLDETLIGGDSDQLWGRYLASVGAVDGERFVRTNRAFHLQYRAGTLDIDAYLRFAMSPLAAHPLERLHNWRLQFVATRIRPLLLPKARELVERHRAAGDTLLIITATNRFVTEPIAELFGVPNLLATEPEFTDGRYTGQPTGIPCFAEGKVLRLDAWLEETGHDLAGSWFYSDSRNDIPLLSRVDHPVAVDPDPVLAEHAQARGWPQLSLRD